MSKPKVPDTVSAKLAAVRAKEDRDRINRAVAAGLPPLALTREDADRLLGRQRNAGRN